MSKEERKIDDSELEEINAGAGLCTHDGQVGKCEIPPERDDIVNEPSPGGKGRLPS